LAVGLYSIIIVLGLTGNLMFCHIVISSAGKWTKQKTLSKVVFYFEVAVRHGNLYMGNGTIISKETAFLPSLELVQFSLL
jgi:hypothetical protein